MGVFRFFVGDMPLLDDCCFGLKDDEFSGCLRGVGLFCCGGEGEDGMAGRREFIFEILLPSLCRMVDDQTGDF